MRKARIVVGANYGDEGKGTVVARYTKESEGSVLCVLTNGGAQRGHSIMTDSGSITYQHFGSGTYYGADSYYSCYFILNPVQFVKEYESLLVKPKNIYRDYRCRWTTPYDMMANHIQEEALDRHASCCMGIWNTIKRFREPMHSISFDTFMKFDLPRKELYLKMVKIYYERKLDLSEWRDVWNSPGIVSHFLEDCYIVDSLTTCVGLKDLHHDNLIFEGGQGLLLGDTGKDDPSRTPSLTGIQYACNLLENIPDISISAHYVTRPYLTRHGDGYLDGETGRKIISEGIQEDRCNHYNPGQGKFRYGKLDVMKLSERIKEDNLGRIQDIHLEVTHCDEMDRIPEFKREFDKVDTYDSPYI